MPYDGLFIQRMTKELNSVLKGARLDKIFQTTPLSFRILMRVSGQRHMLALSADPSLYGAYLTESDDRTHLDSAFSKTLRKHLEGAVLDTVTQHLTDRVMLFRFTTRDLIEGLITKTLVLEAMGRHSNIILVDGTGHIIDSLKRNAQSGDRAVIPGASFSFFMSDKTPFDTIDFSAVISPEDIVSRHLGVSPDLARHLFSTKTRPDDLPTDPVRLSGTQKFHAVDIFGDDASKIRYPTLSALMDDRHPPAREVGVGEKRFIQNQLKRLRSRMAAIEDEVAQAREDLLQKDKADMIYMSGLDMRSKRTDIVYDGTSINLDPTKTLNENAQDLYKRYRKAGRALSHLEGRMKETSEMIGTFEAFETYASIAEATDIEELAQDLVPYGFEPKHRRGKKKKDETPAIIVLETSKATYAIGKNAIQNAYVTHTYASRDDMWFHVKNAPGSHVVVKSDVLDEEVIRTAAMLAARFSKMRHSSSVPVDYTRIGHVRKIAGRHPSEVTYTRQKTIFIDVDEDAVDALFKTSDKHVRSV